MPIRIETRDARSGRPLSLCADGNVRWSSGLRWGDFLAEYHAIPRFDSPEFCFATHCVVLHPGPRVEVERKIRGRYRRYAVGAGDVEIIPAHAPTQVRHGRKDLLVLTFAPELLSRVSDETTGACDPHLREQPPLRDPQVEQIALLLAEEARADFPHGRL